MAGTTQQPHQPRVASGLEHDRWRRLPLSAAPDRLRHSVSERTGLAVPRSLARSGGDDAGRRRLRRSPALRLRSASGCRSRTGRVGLGATAPATAREARPLARFPRSLAWCLFQCVPGPRGAGSGAACPLWVGDHSTQAPGAAAVRQRRSVSAGVRLAGGPTCARPPRPQRDAPFRGAPSPGDPLAALDRPSHGAPGAARRVDAGREYASLRSRERRLETAPALADATVSDIGPDLESRLVWQFGSPRSGSTWLLQMLDQHPLILPVNEPLIGLHLSPFLANDPGYRAEDLDLETFTVRRAMGDDPARFFAESFADVWVPGLRRLLNDRFGAHLARFAKSPPDETIIVIKEPNGSQSADVIMRAQPRARLLFLLRDGRDVVDSTLASLLVGAWGQRARRNMRGVSESE